MLVRLCPRTTVLATSREGFRIQGECAYRVPPLEVPAKEQVEPNQIWATAHRSFSSPEPKSLVQTSRHTGKPADDYGNLSLPRRHIARHGVRSGPSRNTWN